MIEDIINNILEFYKLSDKELDILIEEINTYTNIKKLIKTKLIVNYEKNVLQKRQDYFINNSIDSYILEQKRNKKRYILLNSIIHIIDQKLDLLEYLEENKNYLNLKER